MRRIILTCVLLTGCTTLSVPDFDEGDREAHRSALAEWCHLVGPCVKGASGLVPAPEAPPLPEYSEACGYLPPVYGDDC